MTCACCAGSCEGRQWWNRDTGFGVCPECWGRAVLKEVETCGTPAKLAASLGPRGVDADPLDSPRHLYGEPGVHHSVRLHRVEIPDKRFAPTESVYRSRRGGGVDQYGATRANVMSYGDHVAAKVDGGWVSGVDVEPHLEALYESLPFVTL